MKKIISFPSATPSRTTSRQPLLSAAGRTDSEVGSDEREAGDVPPPSGEARETADGGLLDLLQQLVQA